MKQKILTINSEDDILPYILKTDTISGEFPILCEFLDGFTRYMNGSNKTKISDSIDRNKLMQDYDAMEIPDISTVPRFSIFNTYDCDSICIWNPDMIIPM